MSFEAWFVSAYVAVGALTAWISVRDKPEFWEPPLWGACLGIVVIVLLWPIVAAADLFEWFAGQPRGDK